MLVVNDSSAKKKKMPQWCKNMHLNQLDVIFCVCFKQTNKQTKHIRHLNDLNVFLSLSGIYILSACTRDYGKLRLLNFKYFKYKHVLVKEKSYYLIK